MSVNEDQSGDSFTISSKEPAPDGDRDLCFRQAPRVPVCPYNALRRDAGPLDRAPVGVREPRELERRWRRNGSDGWDHSRTAYLTDTKAYLFDRLNSQIIVWNPETFETVSSFPLDGFAREGLTLNITSNGRVDDRIIITARYFRPDDSTEPLTVLAFVDPETDTVTYDEDRRCGNAGLRATASNGDFYFGTIVTQAALTFAGEGGDPAVTPCQLRVAAGAREIDDDYFLDLTEMASSELVAGPVPGLGDTFYYAIYDPSVVPISDGVTSAELERADAWRLHSAAVGNEQATLTLVPNLPPAGFGFRGDVFRPGEGEPVAYLVQVAGDLSESRLTDISDPASPQPLITVPGIFFGIEQVR